MPNLSGDSQSEFYENEAAQLDAQDRMAHESCTTGQPSPALPGVVNLDDPTQAPCPQDDVIAELVTACEHAVSGLYDAMHGGTDEYARIAIPYATSIVGALERAIRNATPEPAPPIHVSCQPGGEPIEIDPQPSVTTRD